MTTIRFLGAAQTVTGSRHLLTIDGKLVLVDCGLFQGDENLRQKNWAPFPVHPGEIDALVITHAHLDHIGYIPRLVRTGFKGPIYATKATCDLARISLPDSGRIQEEDAYHANKHGSRHRPALPLYTERDAFTCLKQFQPIPYHQAFQVPGGASATFHYAGHILGSAFVAIDLPGGKKLLMSGDLGRYDTPIIRDPEVIESADYLVVESTYGDRLHPKEDTLNKIQEIFERAWKESLTLLVPSFAIGRTQELLYAIGKLQRERGLPRIPIYVDSPMATSTTDVYEHSKEELDSEFLAALDSGVRPLDPNGLTLVRDRNTSKSLNQAPGPLVVIAGSGMANGGRIVHHLQRRLSDTSTLVLFTGYQAEGTLGRRLLDGADMVRILGQEVPVRATIDRLSALSAHADQGEIMSWLKGYKSAPEETFIVHGEYPVQQVLKTKIIEELGWDCKIPAEGESFTLEP